MKLVFVPMVMALVVTTTGFMTTRGPPGQNLIGKMFTLSSNRGGISFYSSYLSLTYTPWPTTTPTTQRYKTTTFRTTTTSPQTATTKPTTPPTTQRYKTTTARTPPTFSRASTTKPTTRPTTASTTYPHWTSYPLRTSALPTRAGVSVCLRYLIDSQDSPPVIFTLSPSSTPLRLMRRSALSYGLSFYSHGSGSSLFLQPNIKFWSNTGLDIWTRVCLTVDTVKYVAQVFSGSSMSVRKMLPFRYVWSGEPVIDFSGFDGQVTDVQIWDYPLCYREIYKYMVTGSYGPHRGSVLTWSSISYSARGDVIMEDVYELQAKQSIKSSSRGRGNQLKGKKKTRKFWNPMEKKARDRQLV